MHHHVAGLRYPHARVLLPRTRLAYIHLRNLLTDAKRDRSARVSGYVAIWLPEEFVMLYMQRGEVVNASIRDRAGSHVIAIAKALEKVPTEPEYGEICFHEADEAQLACMFTAQTRDSEPWPDGLAVSDPAILFPYLMAITFDGAVEIVADESVNYLLFKNGNVERAFMAAGNQGPLVDRVAKLFARKGEPARSFSAGPSCQLFRPRHRRLWYRRIVSWPPVSCSDSSRKERRARRRSPSRPVRTCSPNTVHSRDSRSTDVRLAIR